MKPKIKRGIVLNFGAQISIEIANKPQLLKKLRLSGASHFLIGFESLNLQNLKHINKPMAHDIQKQAASVKAHYARQIKKIQDCGISIHGSFIIGLPFDYFINLNNHTGVEIANFCIDNHIALQPSTLTDLPGSRDFCESQEKGRYLYGKQGTMDYLLALSIADLTESNRRPSDTLANSSLLVGYMVFEALQKVCATSVVLKNGMYMARKAWSCPTYQGRQLFGERHKDALAAFMFQLFAIQYREHARKIVLSRSGFTGSAERLYANEENPELKDMLKEYVKRLGVDNTKPGFL